MQNSFPLDYPVANGGQLGNHPDTGTYGYGYDNPSVEENPNDIYKRFLYRRIFETGNNRIKLKSILDKKFKDKLKKYPEPIQKLYEDKLDMLYTFITAIGMFGPLLLPMCSILHHNPEFTNKAAEESGYSTQEINNFIDKVKDSQNNTVNFSQKDKEIGNWITNDVVKMIPKGETKQMITNQAKEIQNFISTNNVKDTTKSYTSNVNQNNVNKNQSNTTNIKHGGFSDKFINFIKKEENEEKSGYNPKTDLWFPHVSPEGGRATIGYGHKIESNELERKYKKTGLTTAQVEELLIKDLNNAKNRVYGDIKYFQNKGILPKNIKPLTQEQVEMLTDYAFNLGTIRGFPLFTTALINGDIDGMRKEYRRTYRDTNGVVKYLTKRNEDFYNTYLK